MGETFGGFWFLWEGLDFLLFALCVFLKVFSRDGGCLTGGPLPFLSFERFVMFEVRKFGETVLLNEASILVGRAFGRMLE